MRYFATDSHRRVYFWAELQDMFAEFYRKQLAKRLLLNRSASDDDERSLITKLKVRKASSSLLATSKYSRGFDRSIDVVPSSHRNWKEC